jgi:hypothetical protein
MRNPILLLILPHLTTDKCEPIRRALAEKIPGYEIVLAGDGSGTSAAVAVISAVGSLEYGRMVGY